MSPSDAYLQQKEKQVRRLFYDILGGAVDVADIEGLVISVIEQIEEAWELGHEAGFYDGLEESSTLA